MTRMHSNGLRQILALGALVGLIVGCTPMIRVDDSVEKKAPIRVKTSHAIALTPPVFALERGKVVGGHAMNPNRTYHHVHEWGTTFEVDQMEFNHPLRDELTSHGYRFAVGSRAKYKLRATITRLVYNLFGSNPKAGWSEAQVTVKWELIGPRSLQVVTQGSATTRQHSLASLFNAFRAALRNLLARKIVAAVIAPTDLKPPVVAVVKPTPPVAEPTPVIRPTPKVEPPKRTVKRILRRPASSGQPLPQAELVKRSRQATVTVLAGDGWGSGTALNQDGLILTTAHLVSGQARISVVTHDGKEYVARLEATDPALDIALLRTEARGLKALPAVMSQAESGATVLAIGTPYHPALSHSVSKGRVQGHRGHTLTTDARVSAGNTGGPLVDISGRIVAFVVWPKGRSTPSARAAGVTAQRVFQALGLVYGN